jgi:hypothetical protein
MSRESVVRLALCCSESRCGIRCAWSNFSPRSANNQRIVVFGMKRTLLISQDKECGFFTRKCRITSQMSVWAGLLGFSSSSTSSYPVRNRAARFWTALSHSASCQEHFASLAAICWFDFWQRTTYQITDRCCIRSDILQMTDGQNCRRNNLHAIDRIKLRNAVR